MKNGSLLQFHCKFFPYSHLLPIREPEFLTEDTLNYEQLTRLLEADDLMVDTEDNVYYCVTRWLSR